MTPKERMEKVKMQMQQEKVGSQTTNQIVPARERYEKAKSALQKAGTHSVSRPAVKTPTVTVPSVPETTSYASEMSRLQEARRQAAVDLDTAAVADADAKMKALRASAGKQTVGDRVSDVVSGAFNDFGSAAVNTLGVANNAYHDPDFNRRQIAIYTKVLEDGRTTDGKPLTMAMRLKIADNIVKMREEIRRWESEDSTTNKLYKAADTMKETSGKQVETAKEGLGRAGQFAVDVGMGAAQLVGDAAASALLPGAGLAMMGTRMFGSASQEARQSGATIGQQVAYGAASAATGMLTEKLANVAGPFKKAFGGGVLDKALSKITAKPAGKLVLSALSEGSEEALESVMQPVLQKMTYKPDAQYDEEWLAETLYSAAVGAVLGGLGGSVDVIGGGDTNKEVKPETAKAMEELGLQRPAERTQEVPEEAVKTLPAYGTTDAAKQAQFRRAEKLAKRFGVELHVAELGTGSAGQYESGVITIDPTANNPVMEVMVHELTHHMEASGMYQQFATMVERYIAEDMGADVVELKNSIMAEYAAGGFQLDEAGASRELVAKFAETKLFQDEKAIRRLLNEDRTLFEKIREWISDTMVKVRGTSEEKFLLNAQKLYEKALSSAERETDTQSARQLYAGPRARTANLQQLSRAQTMEQGGGDAETIREETGWFRGIDGKWRFEIDDSGMEYYRRGDAFYQDHPEYVEYQQLMNKMFSGEMTDEEHSRLRELDEVWGREPARLSERVARGNARLRDILRHDELFEAYPRLRSVKVRFEDMEDGTRGSYDPNDRTITLSSKLKNAPQDTIIHEVQHAIQDIEKFAGGSSPDYWESDDAQTARNSAVERIQNEITSLREMLEYDEESADFILDDIEQLEGALKNLNEHLYRNTAGEIEARDAAARRELTSEARQLAAPDLGDENTVFAERAGKNSQAIGRTTDNKPFVEVEDDILAGIHQNDWVKTVKRNLKQKFPNGITVGKNDVNIDYQSRKEMTFSEYTKKLRRKNPSAYADKLRATDNADEIILASTNWVNEGLKHPRKDNIRDFARGSVLLRIGSNDYTADVVVGTRKNGQMLLYDILDLKPTSFVEKETDTAKAENPSPGTNRNTVSLSKSSVRENGTDVNVENPDAPRYLEAPGKDAQQAFGKSFEELAGDARYLKTAEEAMSEAELTPEERAVLGRIGEQYRAGKLTREEYDAAVEYLLDDAEDNAVEDADRTPMDTEEPKPAPAAVSVEELPAKAKVYLQRAERKMVNGLGDALSVPRSARREFLQGIAREMSEEYLRSGTVSQESADRLFEQAYAAGIESDTEFYDQYKHIKDKLRTTAVTISKEDSADIADFNDFRRSASNTLRIVNEGGLGVDTAYQELQSMAPELFPDNITHPADQLARMYEVGRSIQVTEKNLDGFYGENAEDFKRWAKNDFEAALWDNVSELRNVKRYAEERAAKQAAEKMVEASDTVRAAYRDIRQARKTAEKAVGRNLLTDYDNVQVGRLLKGEITPEDLDPQKTNIKGVKAVYEAKQEYERLSRIIKEYNVRRRAKIRSEADELLTTANEWKDKKAGVLYSRETMERNVRDIVPDEETAKQIIGKYFKPVHDAQAESTKMKNAYRDRVRALHLSRKKAPGNKVSESHAVQLLGEAQDNIRVILDSKGRVRERDGKSLRDWEAVVENLWAENPDLDRAKIERAVGEFRTIYDELFQQMNEVRLRNGYEPIPYRQGYFPHFQDRSESEGLLAKFGRTFGIETEVTALPTSINGLTHTFKPGIRWFGHASERKGVNTTYDAVQGFDKYIEGAADVIHQTDNIQRLRALATQIRYRTTDDGIREQVDAIRANDALDEDDKQNRIDKIYESGQFALSNFVVELEEYTNLLANKKSRMDRTTEQLLGRNMYNIMKTLEGRVAANMVAVNPGSWLTNFIPITQGAASLDTGTLLRAMGDTLKAYKTDDGMVDRSTFLTNRRGSDPLVRTWAQGASAKASRPMEYIDTFTADTLVRARYQQNVKHGLSEAEAMSEADSWAAGVMADRSKGAMPTMFGQMNPIAKMFTQFQLEVNNQFSYLFKDVPDELKEKGLAALGAGLLKFFVGAFLYNEVYEYVIGRRPALDPIGLLNDTVGDLTGYELPNLVGAGVDASMGRDVSFETERKGTYEAVENLATAAAEELPFVGGLLGGGRVPISSALPDVKKLGKAVLSDTWEPKKKRETIVKELAAPLYYVGFPFGGGQIKKMGQGTEAVARGGSYSVDNEGRDVLQYPVYNDTAAEKAEALTRSVLFGKSSLPTAQEWVEDGFDSYNAKQTAVYQKMGEAGVSDREAHALLEDLRAVRKTDTESAATIQRRVLREADILPEGKTVAYYGLLASEKHVEVMDKLAGTSADMNTVTDVLMAMRDAELAKGEEEKRRKYAALLDADLLEDAKLEIYRAEISDERNDEIETVMDAGLSLDKWMAFERDTAGLKSDDNSTRKEKVLAVIDGMDISEDQKDALFLAAGYSENALENAPWNVAETRKYQLKAPKLARVKLPELKTLKRPKL